MPEVAARKDAVDQQALLNFVIRVGKQRLGPHAHVAARLRATNLRVAVCRRRMCLPDLSGRVRMIYLRILESYHRVVLELSWCAWGRHQALPGVNLGALPVSNPRSYIIFHTHTHSCCTCETLEMKRELLCLIKYLGFYYFG